MTQPIPESENWQRRHRRRPEYSQRSLTLARVIVVHPDSSGRVRTALVKTKTVSYVRPVTKLCLLEAAESSDLTATSLFSTSGSSHVRQSFRDILHRLSTGSSTNEDLNVLATRFECAVNEQEKARFRRRG